MLKYLLKRFAILIPTFIGITIVCFLVIHLAPGEPTSMQAELNPNITPEAIEQLKRHYGLDKPLPVQYLVWMKNLAKLDFGRSISSDARPVWDKIKERLPVTISINVASMVIIFLTAIPLGVISAVRRGSILDRSITVFVFVGFSIPGFWLALICMDYLGVRLGWLPISGLHSQGYQYMGFFERAWDLARHLALPVIISAFGALAGLSRYMRSSMLEIIRQDYILTARAKGLPERTVIYKHAMRNALLPVITILGLSIPGLIGGSVIFESIFSIPGLGKLFYDGIMMRDYNLIMGSLTIGAVLTLLGNLIADIAYSVADPRIRTG
ncbi:MAG: ABC transporter permease [Desulfomonilia bacterium]|jgi:peptide/nickel transport system permease protein|uniref:Oligopeptide transport system permease protein AppB n=1 Tax=anaerobic digester metagenome TaxID=1263854 RepID=A0A485M465_9ZZZZ|nr:ABC transporter permease [Deltaproteobacteria bacterium]HPX19500.1 ABC transporter permease [Deltaproteobacteria bacterium]HRS57349.1 ABC transporter permease [Desulfomonilia bacterium]HRV36879.1 ABC transporter permease [Desulfomonilia bacterium]